MHRRRPPLPTTFGGIAAVAERGGWWLVGWQGAFALLAALVITLSVDSVWCRPIARAVAYLPDAGGIRDARLEWPPDAPRNLYEDSHLSVIVDPEGKRDRGLASDLTLALEPDRIGLRSIHGWTTIPYPRGSQFSLARLDMAGRLAAWRIPCLLVLGCTIFGCLLATWSILAVLYAAILWLPTRLGRRPPAYGTLWRLACISQLPASLVMTFSVATYASHRIGLIALLLAWGLHFVCGWICCLGAVLRWSGDRRIVRNPFSAPTAFPFESSTRREKGFRP